MCVLPIGILNDFFASDSTKYHWTVNETSSRIEIYFTPKTCRIWVTYVGRTYVGRIQGYSLF